MVSNDICRVIHVRIDIRPPTICDMCIVCHPDAVTVDCRPVMNLALLYLYIRAVRLRVGGCHVCVVDVDVLIVRAHCHLS